MVKNIIMKTGNVEGKAEKDFFRNGDDPLFRLNNNKVIVPDEEERAIRARAAPLEQKE